MTWFNVGLIALLACYALSLTKADVEKQKFYIRGIKCNASSKFVNPDFKCFAKSYLQPILFHLEYDRHVQDATVQSQLNKIQVC